MTTVQKIAHNKLKAAQKKAEEEVKVAKKVAKEAVKAAECQAKEDAKRLKEEMWIQRVVEKANEKQVNVKARAARADKSLEISLERESGEIAVLGATTDVPAESSMTVVVERADANAQPIDGTLKEGRHKESTEVGGLKHDGPVSKVIRISDNDLIVWLIMVGLITREILSA